MHSNNILNLKTIYILILIIGFQKKVTKGSILWNIAKLLCIAGHSVPQLSSISTHSAILCECWSQLCKWCDHKVTLWDVYARRVDSQSQHKGG